MARNDRPGVESDLRAPRAFQAPARDVEVDMAWRRTAVRFVPGGTARSTRACHGRTGAHRAGRRGRRARQRRWRPAAAHRAEAPLDVTDARAGRGVPARSGASATMKASLSAPNGRAPRPGGTRRPRDREALRGGAGAALLAVELPGAQLPGGVEHASSSRVMSSQKGLSCRSIPARLVRGHARRRRRSCAATEAVPVQHEQHRRVGLAAGGQGDREQRQANRLRSARRSVPNTSIATLHTGGETQRRKICQERAGKIARAWTCLTRRRWPKSRA